MARILRWKEKLAIAFMSLFFSVMQTFWLPKRGEAQGLLGHSLFLSGATQNTALGVEFMARSPYIRMARASLVPVTAPLITGAYLSMAGTPGAPPPEPSGESSCHTCNTATAPCCGHEEVTCCNPNCSPQCYQYECICQTSGTITGAYSTCTTGYRSWTCYHECG